MTSASSERVAANIRVSLLRTQLQQTRAACAPVRRRLAQSSAANGSLEEHLEDARVAILGFQVDVERERAIQQKLEVTVSQLERQNTCLTLEALEAEKRNCMLTEEVEQELMVEPALVEAVEELRGRFAEVGVEVGAAQCEEPSRLIDAVRAAEASCEVQDAKVRELCGEEVELEASRLKLEAALEEFMEGDTRHLPSFASSFDEKLGQMPALFAEAQELRAKARHLESLACEEAGL